MSRPSLPGYLGLGAPSASHIMSNFSNETFFQSVEGLHFGPDYNQMGSQSDANFQFIS